MARNDLDLGKPGRRNLSAHGGFGLYGQKMSDGWRGFLTTQHKVIALDVQDLRTLAALATQLADAFEGVLFK